MCERGPVRSRTCPLSFDFPAAVILPIDDSRSLRIFFRRRKYNYPYSMRTIFLLCRTNLQTCPLASRFAAELLARRGAARCSSRHQIIEGKKRRVLYYRSNSVSTFNTPQPTRCLPLTNYLGKTRRYGVFYPCVCDNNILMIFLASSLGTTRRRTQSSPRNLTRHFGYIYKLPNSIFSSADKSTTRNSGRYTRGRLLKP